MNLATILVVLCLAAAAAAGFHIIAVVSAQGKTTDRLLQSIEKQKQEQQEILTSALQAQQTPTFSQPMV